MAIPANLVKFLKTTFRLSWNGIHGAPHWARVRDNGLRLADATGANVAVVEYFAFLHDVCREDDGRDPEHGLRAARLTKAIGKRYITLEDLELESLLEALEGHTGGTDPSNVTVATCWDADRLDLGRIDIVPDPRLLMTEAGRDPETIAWALRRSVTWRDQHFCRRQNR
jgi:uncharacterized protein